MNIVTDHASPLSKEILNSLSEEERTWFMCRGQAQAYRANIIPKGKSFDHMKTVYYPMLSGYVVGEPSDTPEDALKAASDRLDHLKSQPHKPFDVAAAGIDEISPRLRRDSFENLLRVEAIYHLGTMRDGSVVESLVELIKDADADRRRISARRNKVIKKLALASDTPSLPGMNDDISDSDRRLAEQPARLICDQIPCLDGMLDEYDRFQRDDVDDLLQDLSERGYEGFLIEASVPMQKPTSSTSSSIHYGSRYTNLFYAHSYEAAVDHALAWAKEKTAEMLSKKAA